MELANEDARAAVCANDEEALRDALGRGADPNVLFIGFFGCPSTLLTYASGSGFEGCCRLLLARGADPNLSNGNFSPIHEACVGDGDAGRCACIRHLLDAGADVDFRDDSGSTALHYAFSIARSGYEQHVKLLIQRGANLEAKNEAGRTPLGYAVAGGTRNTALFLLRAGAKIQILKHQQLNEDNRDINDYMINILNDDLAARAQKHQDACLRVVSRCAPLPRDVMLSIVSYWSLPH